MCDVVKIKNAFEVTNDTERDRFLMHQPVVNPNKPGQDLGVLIGAKFHGASLNKSLLTGLNLLQKPNLRTHTFPTTSICRFNRHQEHVLSRGSVIIRSTIFAFFVVGGSHIKYCGTAVHTPISGGKRPAHLR